MTLFAQNKLDLCRKLAQIAHFAQKVCIIMLIYLNLLRKNIDLLNNLGNFAASF